MPQFNTISYLAIILIAGLIFGRLAKLIKLPNVTGYLVAGLILGPYVTRIIPADVTESFSLISQLALAFIAFTIGCGFKISYFKKVGMTPVIIAVCEALFAVFLVQGALLLAGQDLQFSIVLGSIAAATAPAATLMVIKQYNADGPVTQTLMSVVAIDDAVALMAFSFSVTIAKVIGGSSQNIWMSLLQPFYEIILALVIGIACGILMKIPMKYFKKRGNRLIITAGFVFLASGVASLCGVSELMACMMCGATLCNISYESDSILDISDSVTPPLFLMFFVVSGAQLNISVIPKIGIIGIIYVIVRVIGKMLGATVGAKLMKAGPAISKYLGPTLIPQAGVAIGLTIVAQTVVPHFAEVIRAVILCSTLIYELTGPVITKVSLTKAGEIKKQ